MGWWREDWMLHFFRHHSIHCTTSKQGIYQELICELIEFLYFFPKRIDRACFSEKINKPNRPYLVCNPLCSIFDPGEQEKKAA